MKKRRVFVKVFALILISIFFASLSLAVEKPKLKCLGIFDNFDPNKDVCAQAIEEKTGYKVDYYMLPADQADEKLNIEISSGAEYDFLKVTPAQYRTLVNQKALLPIESLVDKYGPNLKKAISEKSWSAARVDGKIYGIPDINSSDYIVNATAVRQDILEELGLKMPTTPDEFYNVLKTVKEKRKDLIPYTTYVSNMGSYYVYDGIVETIASAYGIATNWADVKGKLVPKVQAPGMKKYLEFMAKLYQEGLLDKEFPINKIENCREKFASGKAFMMRYSWNDAPFVDPALLKNFPNAKIGIIQPLKGAEGQQGIQLNKGIDYYTVILKTSKHAIDAIRFFNLKLEPTTHKYLVLGQEGVHYKVVNGNYLPINPKFQDERYRAWWYLNGKDEANYPQYWQARVRKNPYMINAFEKIMEAKPVCGMIDPTGYAPPLPIMSKYNQSLYRMSSDYLVEVIAGVKKLSEYDRFLDSWDKAGGAEVVKEVNGWYKTVKKK